MKKLFIPILLAALLCGCQKNAEGITDIPEPEVSAAETSKAAVTAGTSEETETMPVSEITDSPEISSETPESGVSSATEETTSAPVITETAYATTHEKPEFEYVWQELYYDEISEWFYYCPVSPNIPMFNVYDLDKNGTPELFLSEGDFHFARCQIFTVENGELKSFGDFGSYGKVYYDYKRKYIFDRYYGLGINYLGVCKFDNNEIVSLISFYSDDGQTGNGITCEIDGEEVSEDVYASEYEKYDFWPESTGFLGYYDVKTELIPGPGEYDYETFRALEAFDYSYNWEEVSEDVFFAEREKYLAETEGEFEVRRYFTNHTEALYALNQTAGIYDSH